MARFLIVSASVGSGHARAAQALQAWIARDEPDAAVQHVDILSFTGAAYRKAYTASYLQLARRAPALWGYLYDLGDRKAPRFKPPRIVRAFDKLEFARFRQFVGEFAPDCLLCTHFLPVQVLASSRRKTWAKFSIGLVVTDFYAHSFWAQPAADRIFLPNEECLEELADRGLERGALSVTGIPVLPQFALTVPAQSARAKLGLGAGPVVLAMGGGWGGGGLEGVARDILTAGDATVMAVAGRDKGTLAALEKIKDSRLHAVGFVENIDEFMAAADVCVTKSGGLTTAECLALGLPMLIPSPIPGQEERNADYASEAGAALQARSPASLRMKLRSILGDGALRARMREAAKAAGRPLAGREIVMQAGALTPQC